MSRTTVTLTNARLIDPETGEETLGGLTLEDGLITARHEGVAEGIDCGGMCLAPGIVDIGVKVCEPGERHKESYRSAGLAAAAGGVTTMITRPDTMPSIDTPEVLEFVRRRANAAGPVHVLPMAALTKGREGREMTEIGFLMDAGAVAFTDCDHVVRDTKVFSRALTYARSCGALVIAHPQEPGLSAGAAATSGKFASLRGLPAVSPMAERMGLDRDIALIEMTGARYHADQITTARALPALERAKANGLDITAGVSIHHLTLNEFDVADYRTYVDGHRDRIRTEMVPIDPAPRIVLDPEMGMLAAGRTVKDAGIAADVYHHTMPVLARAEDHLGGYVPLGSEHLFDVEYWDLEQAKLRRAGAPRELAGQVAVVTGAASGIGRACAAELLDRGAAVVGVDLSPAVADAFAGPAWLGVAADVSDHAAQADALRAGVERFGGLDVLVVGAGVFPGSSPVDDLDLDAWRLTLSVNVDSVAALFRDAAPLLFRSPVGGRVAVIASRNATAPGKGAAAYSTSKAALTQLARVAALEWAEHGVRVNVVHPDNVFDTALWTDELVAQRSAAYGMTPEEYKRRNLLGMEVGAAHVATTVAELCSDRFAATTAAQVPIDGGSERTI